MKRGINKSKTHFRNGKIKDHTRNRNRKIKEYTVQKQENKGIHSLETGKSRNTQIRNRKIKEYTFQKQENKRKSRLMAKNKYSIHIGDIKPVLNSEFGLYNLKS